MAKILVTPDELDQASNTFTQAQSQSVDLVSRLNSTISNFQGRWEGMTQQKFFQEYEAAKQNMQKYIEMLEEVSKELKTIATRFRQADGQ